MSLSVFDSNGRQKIQPSPSGAEVYVPVVLYDQTLSVDGTFPVIQIPSDVSDIQFLLNVRSNYNAISDGVNLALNGDSNAANYHMAGVWGGDVNGGSASGLNKVADIPAATGTANWFTDVTVRIFDVKSSTKYKSFTSINNASRSATQRYIAAWATIWMNTAPITSASIVLHNGTAFVAGSRLLVTGYKLMNLGAATDPGITNGRLTLSSTLPVTTSDVLAATSIYHLPYNGNRISLYTGANWEIFRHNGLALSMAGWTAGKPYDIFCYPSSGNPALEGLVWTDALNRATALAWTDGILTKSTDPTRKYLGSVYIPTTGQSEDSASKRFLWNYWNRKKRHFLKNEYTSHQLTTGVRYWNNDSTQKIEYFCGLVDEAFELSLYSSFDGTGSFQSTTVGLGRDSGTVMDYDLPRVGATFNAWMSPNMTSAKILLPTLGYHYISVLEQSSASHSFYNYQLMGYING